MAHKESTLRVAVVTGRHPFDVVGFTALFRSFSDVDVYVQHLEDFATDPGNARDTYDVVVFYNFHQELPPDDGPWFEKDTRRALERLGETGQGVVVLHHAILAFPEWPRWGELVGIKDRTVKDVDNNQRLCVEVVAHAHPITRGLSDWDMTDETYKVGEPEGDVEVLLTTDHPKSMNALAWTRSHGKARVFCLQSGHDNETFTNPCFREVFGRGIRWCANRL